MPKSPQKLLFDAIEKNDVEEMKFLIKEHSINLNNAKSKGENALHTAARLGHLDLVKYLSDRIDIYSKTHDSDRSTALHLAAKKGHIEVVKYLIEEKSFNINQQDKYKETALHYATRKGRAEVAKILLENNINRHIKNKFKETAATLAQKEKEKADLKFLTIKSQNFLEIVGLFVPTSIPGAPTGSIEQGPSCQKKW